MSSSSGNVSTPGLSSGSSAGMFSLPPLDNTLGAILVGECIALSQGSLKNDCSRSWNPGLNVRRLLYLPYSVLIPLACPPGSLGWQLSKSISTSIIIRAIIRGWRERWVMELSFCTGWISLAYPAALRWLPSGMFTRLIDANDDMLNFDTALQDLGCLAPHPYISHSLPLHRPQLHEPSSPHDMSMVSKQTRSSATCPHLA